MLLPSVAGIIAFSANPLHSSIPNRTGKTRLSIDDYLRCSDLSHLPEHVHRLYAAGHPQAPVLPAQREVAT